MQGNAYFGVSACHPLYLSYHENEDENERDAGEMVEIVMKLTGEIHSVAKGKKIEF